MIVRGIWQPVYARLKERTGVWNTNYYHSGSSNHSPFDSFEFLNKCFCARIRVYACVFDVRIYIIYILQETYLYMWNLPPKSFWSVKKEILHFFITTCCVGIRYYNGKTFRSEKYRNRLKISSDTAHHFITANLISS